MIIQGEHLGTGAGTGTTRQANSTWKMRVQKSIYKSKSSQFTCRTQKWFFVILWWLSTQQAMGNGYNGNLLPPLLFFLITWLHLWLSARTFCAIDLLGLDWVLIYCQETNWSPRYRICLLSFAILLGLDLYPGSCCNCWRWCSMASGARVGKIYPLHEADVSCLDLFYYVIMSLLPQQINHHIVGMVIWSIGQVQGKEELLLGRQQSRCLNLNWCAAGHQLFEASTKWCCFGARWPGALSVWFYWCNQLIATSTKWCSLCADLGSDMHPLSWFKAHSQIWKELC